MFYVGILLAALGVRWFQVQLGMGWWECFWLWVAYGFFVIADAAIVGELRRFLKRESPPVNLNCPLGQSEPTRAPQAKA